MSQSTGTNTPNQLTVNTDVSKIFVWNNRYQNADYNNAGYDDDTLPAGTIMGNVEDTRYVIPWRSDATDGSQIPIGVLASDYTVEGGDTKQVSICVSGDVAESKLVFAKSGDSLETSIPGTDGTQRLRWKLQAIGIKLVGGTEMTAYDNQ